MSTKGRDRRGEKHGSARLSLAQVRRIKAMLAEDRMYMSELAREFGVSATTIRAIKTGRTWREVKVRSSQDHKNSLLPVRRDDGAEESP